MSRYSRNTVIQVLLETTYGSGADGDTYAATDAILISDATINIERDVVPRELIRGFFGGSEQLIAARRVNLEFTVELAGSGTAGTAPAWGKLLQACGMAETVTAGNRVEYTPVTTGQKSLVCRYSIDGVRYFSRGMRGTFTMDLTAYQIPKIRFRMSGFDTSAIDNDAFPIPATNFAAWQRPLVITDGNSGDIRLGATYTAGAIGAGTVLRSQGLEVDIGNTVEHLKLLGGEAVHITGRDTMGKVTVELTAAQEVAWRTDINNNVLTSLGFNIGTAEGNRIGIFAPSVQRVAPQAVSAQGLHMVEAELRFLPSGATGNNDITIVAR